MDLSSIHDMFCRLTNLEPGSTERTRTREQLKANDPAGLVYAKACATRYVEFGKGNARDCARKLLAAIEAQA